jgi:hypothetical protein
LRYTVVSGKVVFRKSITIPPKTTSISPPLRIGSRKTLSKPPKTTSLVIQPLSPDVTICVSTTSCVKETVFLFLQGVPTDINLNEIEQRIARTAYVHSLHHTHIWSLDGERHVFTTHVKLEKLESFEQLLKVKEEIKSILEDYSFEHYTVETELDEESCYISF